MERLLSKYVKIISVNDVCLHKKRLNKINIENAILKKCKVTSIDNLHDKYEAISKLDGEYPIRAICRILKVRRSNYYHYKYRSPEKTQVEIQDEILKTIIQKYLTKPKGVLVQEKTKHLWHWMVIILPREECLV